MNCSDCKHFKDRYTLYMDGSFADLEELLKKGSISAKDFMCEGFGCIFQPCEDFTKSDNDRFMGVPFSDLPDHMEIDCENFEPKDKSVCVLVKNLFEHNEKEIEYFVYRKSKTPDFSPDY